MIKKLYFLLAVSWALIIFAASSQPGSVIGIPNPLDKVVHAATYAVLAWLLLQSGFSPIQAATLAILYGFSDEWHQSFVPGRYPDLADFLADSAGALAVIKWRRRVI